MRVGDAQALPFPDNTFDAAVMALVISFVPDPAKGAGELARVVKSGGLAASYMWDLPNFGVPLSPLYKALVKLGHPAPQPPQPFASAINNMRTMWHDAGLALVETTTLRITVSFRDFDDFWTSNTLPVGPLAKVIGALSKDAIDALKAELRSSLPTQPDGSIAYNAMANAVKGLKIGA
jgi:ubiquinone/menaquinone biosynthesis C-methylase UbiE